MADNPKTLVSTDWLAQHLKDPDLRLLDASWYLPDDEGGQRSAGVSQRFSSTPIPRSIALR